MTEKHLGGHNNITHLDVGTLTFLRDTYNIKKMIDIGQGPGGMVQLAKELGIDAVGIDGDPAVNPDILHDYSVSPLRTEEVDLAWSVEFLEHVYEEYLPNFMETFSCAKYILVTFAKPGEPGHHHVNCQPENYWIEKFAEYGYILDAQVTKDIREKHTTMNLHRPFKKQFIKKNGLFFVREDLL